VLWRKSEQFEPGSNFHAWAFAIAHQQARLARLRYGRDRHRFDDQVADTIAAEAAEQLADLDDRRMALVQCFATLSDDQRDLLRRRYAANEPVTEIAAA